MGGCSTVYSKRKEVLKIEGDVLGCPKLAKGDELWGK